MAKFLRVFCKLDDESRSLRSMYRFFFDDIKSTDKVDVTFFDISRIRDFGYFNIEEGGNTCYKNSDLRNAKGEIFIHFDNDFYFHVLVTKELNDQEVIKLLKNNMVVSNIFDDE